LTEYKTPKFFYGWIIVIVSFFILVISWGPGMHSFGVFFKPLLIEFDWTRAETSGAHSMRALVGVFLGIVIGRLSDRFGPRVLITVCGVLLGLGFLLMSQIDAIWQFYLFYGVVISAGFGGFNNPILSTVARWFVKRRALMTGLVVSGIGVAAMVMPPVATWLISTYGWSTSYIILGITILVFTIPLAQFMRREPAQVGQLPYGAGEEKAESTGPRGRAYSLREALRTRQLWMLGILFGGGMFITFVVQVHIVAHATDIGFSAINAANILAIMGGVSIPGRIIMGSIADRSGCKTALIIGSALVLVSLFCVIVAQGIALLYLFGAIYGFAYGGVAVLRSPMVAELFGLRSHGVLMGVIGFFLAFGNATGPLVAGYVFDITGSYQPAFWVCVAIGGIVLVLTLLLKPLGDEEGSQ